MCFSAVPDCPAPSRSSKRGLEKQKARSPCGDLLAYGIAATNPELLQGEYTARSVPSQAPSQALVPAVGRPRPFLRMSGGTLPVRDFRPPDSFEAELGNIWDTQCHVAGPSRNSQRGQASGVTINTIPGIRSKGFPEGPRATSWQGSGNGTMGETHV